MKRATSTRDSLPCAPARGGGWGGDLCSSGSRHVGACRGPRCDADLRRPKCPHPDPPPLRFAPQGREARFATLLGLALALSACGGQGYSWGWYVLTPFSEKGLSNLQFLFNGVWSTLSISIAAIALSVVIGAVVALCAFSRQTVLRRFNRTYVELVRAVPLLVMVLWVYYGLPIMAGVQFGIFAAGVLALALSDSAFEAEVFRAGIQSIDKGQIEAAKAVGLRSGQVMRFVVLPQAVRRILPALGNQFVYMLKMSSILSFIGYQELTRRAHELNTVEQRPLELYTFLIVEYLVLILIASWFVRRLELRMARAYA